MNPLQTVVLILVVVAMLAHLLPMHHSNSQLQTNNERFFMTMKLQNPSETISEDVTYEVTNITTNMDDFGQNGTVQYDLDDIDVTIDYTSINWGLPFKIIDTSTPNIVKTRNGDIRLFTFTEDYEKQFNTLTNITSYTGKNTILINEESIADVNLKAVISPNGTGTLEMLDSRNQTAPLNS